MSVGDWVSLLLLVGLVVGFVVGRRRGMQRLAAALAAARAEGHAEASAELRAQLIQNVTVTGTAGASDDVRDAELRILRAALRAVSTGPGVLDGAGSGFELLARDVGRQLEPSNRELLHISERDDS